MRVISGSFRGRSLRAPKGRDTRPILDRQKEALFNIIRGSLPCGGVLDLFAGSGALGIEALSRGAETATFVERARPALLALEANLAGLSLEAITRVLRIDALRLRATDIVHPLGIVFCDPPFPLYRESPERVVELLGRLSQEARMEPGALIVLRIPSDARTPQVGPWLAEDDRREMGESRVLLLRPVGEA
jgi:16S rRNA (guanine966-N2)-methyltransferase